MASSDSDSEAASSGGEGDSRESATQSRNFASDIADTLALLTDPLLRRGSVLGSVTRYKANFDFYEAQLSTPLPVTSRINKPNLGQRYALPGHALNKVR